MKRKLLALGLTAVLTFSMSVAAVAAETQRPSPTTTTRPSPTTTTPAETPTEKPTTTPAEKPAEKPTTTPAEKPTTTPAAKPTTTLSSGGSSSSDSSSDSGSSSTASAPASKGQATTVDKAVPGGKVDAKTVKVAIVGADGKVVNISLGNVISSATATITSAASESPAQVVLTLQALMTTAPTPFFAKTIEALVAAKGSAMAINNCGTVKTAAVAKDALGNTIASAGVIKNVTSGALIMLMSVNSDGKVEYVEGVVDPVTNAVLGAFKGVPQVITVLVFA